MKKSLLIYSFLLSVFVVFSQNTQLSNSHQNIHIAPDSISVIISPGTSNEKIINDIEGIIKLQQGVEFVEYCSNHNIFIVTVNRTIYPTNELFYTQLKTVSGVATLLLKEGNKAEIISFCEFKKTEKLINPELEKALLDK